MACELLVMREWRGIDRDDPGSYRPGTVIIARPVGWRWGRKEDPDQSEKFYVVTIEDREHDDPEIKALMNPLHPRRNINEYVQGMVRPAFLDLNAVPRRARALMTARGRFTTSFVAFRRALRQVPNRRARWTDGQ